MNGPAGALAAAAPPSERSLAEAVAVFPGLPPGPKVNLGCGPVQPAGWVNVDGSLRAMLAHFLWPLDRLLVRLRLLPKTEFGPHVTVHDLRKPLPFRDGSVACIYAGEVWEHFEYADAARLTRECARVLAPGGVLRLCVPDGIDFWGRYIELFNEMMSRPRQDRSAKPLREHVHLFFRCIATRRLWLRSLGSTHKWQYDELQLVELLEESGLACVERKAFHRSAIPDVSSVEIWDQLIVEAVKPAW